MFIIRALQIRVMHLAIELIEQKLFRASVMRFFESNYYYRLSNLSIHEHTRELCAKKRTHFELN